MTDPKELARELRGLADELARLMNPGAFMLDHAATAIEQQAARIDELEANSCQTCGGSPHASGLICVCGGTGLASDETIGLRLHALSQSKRIDELERTWWSPAAREIAEDVRRGQAARIAELETERNAATARIHELEGALRRLAGPAARKSYRW